MEEKQCSLSLERFSIDSDRAASFRESPSHKIDSQNCRGVNGRKSAWSPVKQLKRAGQKFDPRSQLEPMGVTPPPPPPCLYKVIQTCPSNTIAKDDISRDLKLEHIWKVQKRHCVNTYSTIWPSDPAPARRLLHYSLVIAYLVLYSVKQAAFSRARLAKEDEAHGILPAPGARPTPAIGSHG